MSTKAKARSRAADAASCYTFTVYRKELLAMIL